MRKTLVPFQNKAYAWGVPSPSSEVRRGRESARHQPLRDAFPREAAHPLACGRRRASAFTGNAGPRMGQLVPSLGLGPEFVTA